MNKLPTISICTILKNEKEQMPDFLLALVDFAEEIIIVDTGSTDGTREIVKEFQMHGVGGGKIKLYDYVSTGIFHYGMAKSHSIQKASCDYFIILDADERLSSDFKIKIRKFLQENKPEVVSNRRVDELLPHFIDERQERVIKNGLSIFYGDNEKERVHAYLKHNFKSVDFEPPIWHCQREKHLLHAPHRLLLWVKWEVDRIPKTTFLRLLYRAVRGFCFKFKKVYVTQEAYKDGMLGFRYAFIKGWYILITNIMVGLKSKDGYKYWEDKKLKLLSRDDF